MKRGAIILCGGRSSRMGVDKATLPFGDELMLERVVRLLAPLVEPIVVVASTADQRLPVMPPTVSVTHDRYTGRGPIEGLAAGLTAIGDRAEAVYATSCDVPLLVPAFVARLFNLLDERSANDRIIVVPRDGKFHHPLSAVYRTSVLPQVEQLLAADRLRPVFLFDAVPTLEVPVDSLRDVDPELLTLANLNRPADYLAALARAGLSVPADIVARLSADENSR